MASVFRYFFAVLTAIALANKLVVALPEVIRIGKFTTTGSFLLELMSSQNNC